MTFDFAVFKYKKPEGVKTRSAFIMSKPSDNYMMLEFSEGIYVDLVQNQLREAHAEYIEKMNEICEAYGLAIKSFSPDKIVDMEVHK